MEDFTVAMNDSILPQTPPILEAGSPPPKCAICLGVCANKCFSDSCMHEFCFSCLLEWSKIKAECPLCKKPFKSILHDVKSNEDYKEYVIHDPIPTPAPFLDGLYLPHLPSRHFQFRTTFTVDPGGELAIQQMLLSHPLTTNNNYNFPLLHRYRSRHGYSSFRLRGVSSATSFRRSIYALNYWVSAPPDVTGRYRSVSPEVYRSNPTARNRLVPWLNRELNALLRENTQQVMNLVDVIMEHLSRWHIRSRSFRSLLVPSLNDKTDHFLHEFYNFMRSPYDMIGYDQHITYAEQPTTYTFTISDYDDDDSDVAIVNEPITIDNNPFRQPTIEVITIDSESANESDVMIRETPVEVIDLIQSDSDNNQENNCAGGQSPFSVCEVPSDNSNHTKPILPLKIRLKRKHLSREKTMRKKRKSKRFSSSSSYCSGCSSSSSSSSSSSESSHHKFKKKRKYKKNKSRSYRDYKKSSRDKYKLHKYKKVESTSSSSTSSSSSSSSSSTTSLTTSGSSGSSCTNGIKLTLPKKRKNITFDSDDNIPLSKLKTKESKPLPHTVTSKTLISKTHRFNPLATTEQSCSMWQNAVLPSSSISQGYYSGPSTSSYNYHYRPSLAPFLPIDNRSSLTSFEPSTSHFTPPNLPTFQQAPLSFTPPLETNLPYYKNCYPNSYNQERNVSTCVNVSVGTSPIKDTNLVEYHNNVGSCSTAECIFDRVIVKKEQRKSARPQGDEL